MQRIKELILRIFVKKQTQGSTQSFPNFFNTHCGGSLPVSAHIPIVISNGIQDI